MPNPYTIGALVGTLLVITILVLNWRNVHANIDMFIVNLIESTITRSVVRHKQLVVGCKYEIPANSHSYVLDFQLDRHSPIVRIVRQFPERDLWVIGSSIRIIGPVYFTALGVSVGHERYMSVAPGDTIDNPHFGVINPEAWVEPEISYQYACPQ